LEKRLSAFRFLSSCFVIARSEMTKQSSAEMPFWIASLSLAMTAEKPVSEDRYSTPAPPAEASG
jgi:hypothetical protein